jgi:hypothetical protein
MTNNEPKKTAGKYDPNYNVHEAVRGLRANADLIGEFVQSGDPPDPAHLKDWLNSVHDYMLYTLGWLEHEQKQACEPGSHKERWIGSLDAMIVGVQMLLRDTEEGKAESLDLADTASVINELAYSLEQYAQYAGITDGRAS